MTRSLADLYVRGKTLELTEDTAVWIQKLNPVEHATALRKASAARARVLAWKNDKDSDEYQALLNDILDLDADTLIMILAAAEEARITPARRAKVAEEKGWKEDDYLEGLFDLWRTELFPRILVEPDDPEANRVKAELDRYEEQVAQEINSEIESFKRSLSSMTANELIESSMENRLRMQGDVAWINEYHKVEVMLGTRDKSDHKKKLFPHRDSVDDLQAPTLKLLIEGFAELTVEPSEGKDSAGLPPSSDSSEQSAKEETEASSGLVAAAA